MRRLIIAGLALLTLGLLSQPAARADSSLQSVLFNVNGAMQTDYAGFNTSAWNATTGIGTLTYLFNPGAAGTYNFTAFFDNQLVKEHYFNEFGSASGSLAPGQSWEIGDSFASTIYNDAYHGTLNYANMLPGQTSNYFLDCQRASCNGDAALAMGFHFLLGAGQKALITLTFSTSAPGSGFFLTQTHPVDPENPSTSSIYFSGSEVTQPVVGAPEPGSLLLLGISLAGLWLLKGRKLVSRAI